MLPCAVPGKRARAVEDKDADRLENCVHWNDDVVQSLTIDEALTAQPSRGYTAAESSPK
jgi:hypothetical protein